MSDNRIRIEFSAIENGRTGYGWIPAVYLNGRSIGSTWYPQGTSKELAREHAEADARELASRYIGDWDISVSERVDQ